MNYEQSFSEFNARHTYKKNVCGLNIAQFSHCDHISNCALKLVSTDKRQQAFLHCVPPNVYM